MKDVYGSSYVGGDPRCMHRNIVRYDRRRKRATVCCQDCEARCACHDCSGFVGDLVRFLDSDAANYVAGAALLGFAAAVVAWVMR